MNRNHSAITGAPIAPLASNPKYFSWGRFPEIQHNSVYKPYWSDQIATILAGSSDGQYLPYGLGRSYGDSCLNAGRSLIDCSRLDRILRFDNENGRILCEAGVSLAEILNVVVRAGWFLPVTPGTKFVTVGGAIANDVHGKNHHRVGTFGVHVKRLLVCRSDLGIVECSPTQNADLFCSTIGGLGLTGVILCAEFTLKKILGGRVDSESIPFESIEDFQKLSTESDSAFEYVVAWIDCFSGKSLRGIFFRGNHSQDPSSAQTSKPAIQVPFLLPRFLLNRQSLRLFNSVYYHWKKSQKSAVSASLESFFYPLDTLRNWNLIYGKPGFVQYQCVIPESMGEVIEEILAKIAYERLGSFLAVLKRFGAVNSPALMSFPRPGLTLALDFPMRGERTLLLLESLDQLVLQSGGALYPAKDARMSPRMFEASFPNWRQFARFIDPALSSSFWRRVTQT